MKGFIKVTQVTPPSEYDGNDIYDVKYLKIGHIVEIMESDGGRVSIKTENDKFFRGIKEGIDYVLSEIEKNTIDGCGQSCQ